MEAKNVEFEPFIIYESIVCVKFPNSAKINSSCMGVHFTPTDEVYLHAYEDTDTKKLLKNGARFSINFSDSFVDYARAAILGKNSGKNGAEIPEGMFKRTDPFPSLKNSWLTVECKVIKSGPDILVKPPCRRRKSPNIRTKILNKYYYRPPRIFNNRSMNLAIEALILATRIPLYKPLSEDYNFSLKLYKTYKNKIESWRDMDRFEEGFQLTDNYLIDNGVKAREIYDM